MTSDEKAIKDSQNKVWNDASASRKLTKINMYFSLDGTRLYIDL